MSTKNIFVFSVLVVPQLILCFHYNEWENNGKYENNTLWSVSADYECEHNSYFQSISKSYEFQQQIYCNELFVQIADKPLIDIGHRNGRDTALNQIDTTNAVKDENGKEVFWRMGRVRGGDCDGDLLFVQSFSIPTKGSCDSYTGVTHVRSTKTLYAVRGKCESTCFGHRSVHYEPGKRSQHKHE